MTQSTYKKTSHLSRTSEKPLLIQKTLDLDAKKNVIVICHVKSAVQRSSPRRPVLSGRTEPLHHRGRFPEPGPDRRTVGDPHCDRASLHGHSGSIAGATD